GKRTAYRRLTLWFGDRTRSQGRSGRTRTGRAVIVAAPAVSEPGRPRERTRTPHHHPDFARPFGGARFGRYAERFARFFGTPRFILGQTVVVAIWIVLNVRALHLGFAWDVYPFILLNLSFSLQAAYAAPLILLAQTRQAARDGLVAHEQEAHREEVAARQVQA